MTGRSKPTYDSWVVVGARALLASAAAVAAWHGAATAAGLAAGAVASAAGVVTGELLARSRVRLAVIWLASGGVAAAGLVASRLATWSVLPSRLLGTSGALSLSDGLLAAGLAAGLWGALRATGARHRPAVALEVGAVGLAFAVPLAAHRDGAINRPLALGDHAWAMGHDPVSYLELAGAVAAVGLALFLVAERRWTRALAASLLVLLLASAAGLVATTVRAPALAVGDGLGLTGEGRDGERGRGGGPRSTDQLDFRDSYPDRSQSAPVAVVLLHDDHDPSSGVFYFRQAAFSRWNGRRLVAAAEGAADRDVLELFPAVETRARWVPPAGLRAPVRTSVGFLVDHVLPVALEAPESIAPARNPAPRRFRRVYDVRSLSLNVSLGRLLGSEVGDPAWSEEVRAAYLEVPADARYRAHAEGLLGSLPPELGDDPIARVIAVALDLGDRGTYSRTSRHAEAADPTASFLFGDVTGYCVHFAHAAALLYRAMGVPSRVATGYAYPAAERGRGSALLLRGGDAHAWPEVFVRDAGWVVVDVTPARIAEPGLAPLDEDLQRMLGEMLRGGLDEQRRATLEVGRARLAPAALVRALGALAGGAAFSIAVLLALLYLGKTGRRLAPVLGPARSRTRLAYLAGLARLADAGRRRARGEPPETFAARVAATSPSFAGLVRLASARKLGSRAPDDPDAALALARRLGAELRVSVPWWRRLLGALDPISWTRAR